MTAGALRRCAWGAAARCARAVGAACFAVALGGCESPPPPVPFTPVTTVKLLMSDVIEPAADRYWDAVGSVSDKNGVTEHAPRTDEEWTAVRASATVVAESGNLLMMEPRALDRGEWMALARAMVTAGVRARAAAEARDTKRVFDAGADLYETCSGCHAKYLVPVTSAASSPASSPAASPAAGAAASPAARPPQ